MRPRCLPELEAQRSISPDLVGMRHPDFAVLTVSWELALRADGYADNTVSAYQTRCAAWPTGWPSTIPRSGRPSWTASTFGGWLVEVRERHSSNTARGWFAGSGTSAGGSNVSGAGIRMRIRRGCGWAAGAVRPCPRTGWTRC
jgi:hypothetical protein